MRNAGALSRLLAALAAAIALAGCGGAASADRPRPKAPAATTERATATPTNADGVALVRDPEEKDSFPLPPGTRGARRAPKPGAVPAAQRRRASRSRISPGAPSDAEVRRELKQMDQALAELAGSGRRSGSTASGLAAALDRAGRARVPVDAPDAVARLIAGGNAIASYPYIWGGGHGSFVDTGYDCSGSVSYALAAAGLLDAPLTSGQLADWGAPGPGRWVTIYANAGHVFMLVGGLRFDTSGRDGPLGSRWQTAPRSLRGFEVRHPPGL